MDMQINSLSTAGTSSAVTVKAAAATTATAATTSRADSATFSPAALAALQASLEMSMLQGLDGGSGSSSDQNSTTDSFFGDTSGSSNDPLAALFGSSSPTSTDPASLAKLAETDPQAALNAMASSLDQSGSSGSTTQDGLAAMLTQYGQSIAAQDATLIQQAEARITGSGHATGKA